MNFINLGSWELVLIVVIAILAVGPKRLVQIVRTIQRWSVQARKLTRQMMGMLQTELDAADELKGTAQEALKAVKEIQHGVTETMASADEGGDSLAATAQEATAALQGLKQDLARAARQIDTDGDQNQSEADQ